MKVYLIEQGDYSDRRNVGVVETEEEAKKVCAVISRRFHEARYTEFDTHRFRVGKFRFLIECSWDEWGEPVFDLYDTYKMVTESCEYYEDFWIVYADTPDQAVKIAQDMRAERLAKEEGIV